MTCKSLLTALILTCSFGSAFAQGKHFAMGTPTRPDGQSIFVDSRSVIINGKPVIPVMGEVHYARVPEQDWKREILKMKAGGVTILATYVFWIHHEDEVEGQWDWSGNRNLRRFIETCQEVGMPVVLRIGPFCHGEVYQGGFPCWLVRKSASISSSKEGNNQSGNYTSTDYKLRSLGRGFIDATAKFYNQIGAQVNGLMWKDGGPIIGIQIENECRGPWAYFTKLLELAKKADLDAPIYTRTGWPAMNGKAEFGKILPLYGDYGDGFWDRKLTDMPGEYPQAFIMKENKVAATIATETFSKEDMQEVSTDQNSQPSTDSQQSLNSKPSTLNSLQYPYLTCELGGGMMPSYHRRINMSGREAAPLCICKLGSGSNLPGYYMYHGGTNPWSPNHTMAETQSSTVTNYNDMPIMSYDFQTILGEMGQPDGISWHETRWVHQFLADWGSELSQMDVDSLSEHYARRGQFVFRNDYVRILNEDGHASITPQDMQWEGLSITSNDIQPFAKADGGLYFIALPHAKKPSMMVNGKRYSLKLDKAQSIQGKMITILSANRAKQTYVVNGKTHYSEGLLYADGNNIIEEVWKTIETISLPFRDTPTIFIKHIEQTKKEGALRDIPMGSQKVASQPTDTDFADAAVWSIDVSVPAHSPNLQSSTIDPQSSIFNHQSSTINHQSSIFNHQSSANNQPEYFLSISYRGDCARVYADGKLVEDNFWNGKSMLVRLSDLVGKHVELKVLPLRKDAPIYLQEKQKAVLENAEGDYMLCLDSISVVGRM